MKTENIKNLIENSEMNKLQKNIAIGFINKAEKAENDKLSDIKLIEDVAREKRISDVLYSSEDVKIYSISGTSEWDVKFPIRIIYLTEKGNWQRCSTVSPTFEIAYLIYLENKYLGSNSQFSEFAIKMLGIKIEE